MMCCCKKLLVFIAGLFSLTNIFCQRSADSVSLFVTVVNEQQQPLESAIVSLLRSTDSTLIKTAITNVEGKALLEDIPESSYYCSISYTGYTTDTTASFILQNTLHNLNIVMRPASNTLQDVVVSSHKPFIQREQGKVLVNVDADPTNAGTNTLELLEKLPGVTVDRNGTISLQAKQGVLILIDGKQTYLQGIDLISLLSSMSSSEVDQV